MKKILRYIILLIIAAGIAYGLTYLIENLSEIINDAIENDVHSFILVGLPHFLEILFNLLSFAIVLTIFFRSENIQSKMAWLLFFIISPEFGLVLFICFGREFKKTKRFKKATRGHDYNYLVHEPTTDFSEEKYSSLDHDIFHIYKVSNGLSKHHVYVNDSEVNVLTNGDKKFPRLIEELKKAEDYIFMSYFIIKTDNIGKEVMNILKEKAEAGLDVRLMYDYLGGMRANSGYLKTLKKAGVKVVAIDKFSLGVFTTKVNYRNHRKMTIIDSKVGFIGGLNLGDEYNHGDKKFGFWRDTHLVMKGPILNSLMSVFVKDYYYATGDFIEDKKFYAATPVQNPNGSVQVIQSGPDSRTPIIRDTYLKMITEAHESIKIASPYFILDTEILSALKIAATSGVKIQVLVPGLPDKKAVYHVTESMFEPLQEFGVEFYKYNDTFVHSKILIVDDKIASCGTFNMDIRSFIINWEATVLMTGNAVEHLVNDFNNDIYKESTFVDPIEWKKRSVIKKFKEGMLNIFSPLM